MKVLMVNRMIEVAIKSKLNNKKRIALFEFLKSISTEVCFSSYHDYHLSEDCSIELLDEYKAKCKEKHHELKLYYQENDPFLLKTLKKLKIKDEETFEEYRDQLYQNDILLSKQLEKICEDLEKKENIIDYREVFTEIKDDFLYIETHVYDSVGMSLIPIDCVVYNFSNKLLEVILRSNSFLEPILFNSKYNIYFFNMVFCKNEEVFCIVCNEKNMMVVLLNEEEYEKFLKLKIKHKRDVIKNETK